MNDFIPAFDFQSVVVEPWTFDAGGVFWIILMGFLANATCGIVGTFLVYRRMALVGDAISHSLLPGIVLAFLITSSRDSFPMMIGAIIAGAFTVFLIEAIHRSSRVKPDAALGIVFSFLFAVGVIMLALFADRVDLDPDCVLYGEIGFIPLMDTVSLGGMELGPRPVVLMGSVFLIAAVLTIVFYKGLLVTSFDPALALSLGIRVNFYHYGLMAVLSLSVVSAFEAVGAILVIAMLIFPAVTASMVTDRLPFILVLTLPLAFVYSVAGYHLALWLDTSIAGAMVVVATLIFGLLWIVSPRQGLIIKGIQLLRSA
ncbi:metal ABC transporter permease [Rubellicoccus peritrichatus]|uniref:Metal ABC transporter permease n=1 Tax=Rubellicoccus peritrichatus TaxID=3080537 RepID=A0AAQ3QT47_9BACT|nr:metal ABC transporter permease [Puniceicoccus sp. CR14]WOO40921.1 metal ABC transporter permease [Puniceicoccus sp. CR14]